MTPIAGARETGAPANSPIRSNADGARYGAVLHEFSTFPRLTGAAILYWSAAMSSRAKVDECVMRVRTESKVEEKLNAVADAINAFAGYVEQIEHLLRHVETRLRHMELG